MGARDDELKRDLARAGIADAVAQAALDIDAVLQRWRRKFIKRELGSRAIEDLGLTIDLAQLDVLIAVWAPSNEFAGASGEETMVSTVASRLSIDPSRASRLTAELIRQGLLRRAISRQDARRTVLELTGPGARIVEAVRSYKFLVLGAYLRGWTAEEVATFLPLLERFSAWTERTATPPGPVSDEIAALRAALAERSADLPVTGAAAGKT